jgi:NitT/TauT family transport system permease protein
VDPLFVKAARSMRVSEFELFRYVILPGSVPSILSGLRLGVKNSLLLVTGAEMIAASTGLGFYIQNARFIFDTKSMYAGILIMVFFGIVANYSMVWIEKKFTYWKIDNDEAVL